MVFFYGIMVAVPAILCARRHDAHGRYALHRECRRLRSFRENRGEREYDAHRLPRRSDR